MRVTLTLLLLPLFLSCHSGNPIENAVNDAKEAVESRDSSKVAATLTDDFSSQGANKEAVVGELRQYLMGYRNLAVTISDLKVASSEDHGSADFVATATGQARHIGGLDQILPESTKLRFHVTLRQAGSRWQFDSATWAPAD